MSWRRTLILAIALAFGAGGGCSKKDEQTSAPDEEWPQHGLTEAQANEVLVTIGERTITVGEFADRLASQSPYLQARFESPERRREFLDNLVRFELLVYEAKRRGYADKPEIQRARRTAMTQQLIKREVEEHLKLAEITDEEIQALYDANPEEYDRPAQVRASDILIKDRADAEKVLAQAKKSDINKFRQLARKKSEDEASKKDGGDLQFFTANAEGHPPKAVRDAAFTLNRVGEVFPELVKTAEGYHIVMLTGKRAPLKRTYEQAKRAIRHKLAREKKDVAMEALLERLRKDVKVEIDYDALADVKVDIPDLPQGQ
jgi:peptidyl-prolyl cis-trans isomerase C